MRGPGAHETAQASPRHPARGPGRETSTDPGGRDPVGNGLGLGWRGALVIVGFWTLFGVVTVANTALGPVGPAAPLDPEVVALIFLGAWTWAALTPAALWITARLPLEQGDDVRRVLLLILIAVGMAAAVAGVLGVVGSVVLDPGRGPGAPDPSTWIAANIRFRFLSDLTAGLLVVAAGTAWDYFRRYQARREEAALLRARLVESRLQVLRAQLDPHFLFNTLNAISGLVARDPAGVRRMISRLSDVLRYSLQGAREPEVPLEEELRILQRYLEILEIRYQGRLETSVEAPPEVLRARVPTLVLQPLAENAMKHGIAPAGGHGRIEVRARRTDGRLVLTVRDTGAVPDGPPASGTPLPDRRPGLGLAHTRRRLAQLHGEEAGLSLRPVPGGGTVAEIVLPFRTTPRTSAPALPGPDSPRPPETGDG